MKIDNSSFMQTAALHAKAAGLASPSLSIPTATEESTGNVHRSFGEYLLDAVSKMNESQIATAELEKKFVADPESVEIHEITNAMAKAQMSLSLAKSVIDRVVTGWSEITTTR